MAAGPAAPAHRGVEIHRPPRADARCAGAGGARRAGRRARRRLPRADVFAAIDRARIVFVNGHFVPSLSDMAGLDGRRRFRLARPLPRGRRRDPRPLARSGRGADLRAEQRLRARRRGAPHPRRRKARAAAGDRARLRRRRARPADAAPPDLGRRGRRRRRSCRPFPAPTASPIRPTSSPRCRSATAPKSAGSRAQEEGDAGDPPRRCSCRGSAATCASIRSSSRPARSCRAAKSAWRSRAEHSQGRPARRHDRARQAALDTTLVVNHAAPHCAGQEYFKAAMDGQSQGVFQGKIIVEPGAQKTNSKMMSRALLLSEGSGVRQQAGARDFRRRRGLRPRRDLRADRRADAVLPALARHRRRPRRERMLVLAFLAEAIEMIGDEAIVAALEARTRRWLGMEAEAALMAGKRRLRRREDPRGFPDPVAEDLRQAAGLSRQCRLGAEAARRARPHPARLHGRIRQRPSRPALPRERRDRGLRGCARDGAPLHQRAVGRGDHLHPLLDRGDQPRRAVLRRHADRGGRRDRPLHPRAPFQHRALALSTASGAAR